MSIVPLHGHAAVRTRLGDAFARGRLPASLLLQGPRGIGKQRLALWLGQALLCATPLAEREGAEPCAGCQGCRYARDLTHPDLHWFFPRPRLKDADASSAEVLADFAAARAERREVAGLYGPGSGLEGLYVPTIRTILQQAAVSPALGRRKVFVLGDAERMVPQESSPEAANALLKLLEEPPADTTLVLTSSEPGALLPTIRSRVVAVRVPPLAESDVRGFLTEPAVAARLTKDGQRTPPDELARLSGGAPGMLFAGAEHGAASAEAERLLASVLRGGRGERLRVAFAQGASKARGAYSDVLDALTVRLRDLAFEASQPAVAGHRAPRDPARALAASRGMDAVERAKARAAGNVSPQLVTAELLRELAGVLR